MSFATDVGGDPGRMEVPQDGVAVVLEISDRSALAPIRLPLNIVRADRPFEGVARGAMDQSFDVEVPANCVARLPEPMRI